MKTGSGACGAQFLLEIKQDMVFSVVMITRYRLEEQGGICFCKGIRGEYMPRVRLGAIGAEMWSFVFGHFGNNSLKLLYPSNSSFSFNRKSRSRFISADWLIIVVRFFSIDST